MRVDPEDRPNSAGELRDALLGRIPVPKPMKGGAPATVQEDE